MEEKEVTGVKVWKIFLIIIIILMLGLLVFFISKPKKEIKKDINNNYENQIVDNLSFEKIKIYSKNNNYYFTAKVVNKNDYDIVINTVDVTLKGEKTINFKSYIGKIIKKSKYKMITMQTKEDLSSIKIITFNIN